MNFFLAAVSSRRDHPFKLIVFQQVNKKNAMIYGFEAAFFSSNFSNGVQASLALSNSFSASWTFFISALPSSIPAHFARALLIFFSRSASAALFI